MAESSAKHLYYGDINGDGKINIEDILLCQLMILYGEEGFEGGQIQRADANNDGIINALDLIKIRNYILGIGTLERI